MPTVPRILVFGGSLRRESYNQKRAAIAAQGAREAGAEVTLIALRDYPLPVFDVKNHPLTCHRSRPTD